MTRIYIVDDHKILSQALFDYLHTQTGFVCVGMAHSAREAISQIPEIQPDVIIMDIGMPEMDGIQCTQILTSAQPQLNIVGLSTHLEISVVKKLFKAGARAYLSKNAGLGEITLAIKKVISGERYIGEVIRKAYLADLSGEETPPPAGRLIPQLTDREREILILIAEEYTTEEIAEKLFISKNTVQTHRKNLISKFGVRSSIGVIIKALEYKLI